MGTTDLGDLYTADAQIVNVLAGGHPWARGQEAVRSLVRAYSSDSRFVPNAYALDDAAGYIAGVSYTGNSPEPDMNFFLGLEKDRQGTWQISTEYATAIPPRRLGEPITADELIEAMDVAGTERAVVLSVAYFFGHPERDWPGDEYTNVRAENDWTVKQVSKHPSRLVAFCSFNPLKDYALEELQRCDERLRVTGVKLHFGASGIDIEDPEHVAKVRRVFEAANERRLPLVVHLRAEAQYGREDAEVFLEEILPAAPDVPVQIAHLWGGGRYANPRRGIYTDSALAVFARAVAAGDPRSENLYFDLGDLVGASGGSEDAMQAVAERIRQIGLHRILYGSDVLAGGEFPAPALAWPTLRTKIPLTDEEMRVIAGNVAPYLK